MRGNLNNSQHITKYSTSVVTWEIQIKLQLPGLKEIKYTVSGLRTQTLESENWVQVPRNRY